VTEHRASEFLGATSRPTIVESLAALAEAVRTVRKTERNTHSNYNFRGIDSVLNAVGPAMRKHCVVCIPTTLGLEQSIVQTTSGKPQTSSRVRVRYTFWGPAGDHMDAVVWGESWDGGDKGLAQAYSVAYRTCLLQTLTIPTDDPDPDATTVHRAEEVDLVDRALVEQYKALPDPARARIDTWVQRHAGVSVDTLPSSWTVALGEAIEKERRKLDAPTTNPTKETP
jgi:hypothetical protein